MGLDDPELRLIIQPWAPLADHECLRFDDFALSTPREKLEKFQIFLGYGLFDTSISSMCRSLKSFKYSSVI